MGTITANMTCMGKLKAKDKKCIDINENLIAMFIFFGCLKIKKKLHKCNEVYNELPVARGTCHSKQQRKTSAYHELRIYMGSWKLTTWPKKYSIKTGFHIMSAYNDNHFYIHSLIVLRMSKAIH